MQKYVVVGLCFLVALLLFLRHLGRLVYPNTYLNSTSLKGYSKERLLQFLSGINQTKVKIKVKDRVYTFTQKDLGVSFDLNSTFKTLYPQENLGIGASLFGYFSALKTPRKYVPTLKFGSEFYAKVDKMRFDFSVQEDEVNVVPERQILTYVNNQEIYAIDAPNLAEKITISLGSGKVVVPKLHRVMNAERALEVAKMNERLAKVFAGG